VDCVLSQWMDVGSYQPLCGTDPIVSQMRTVLVEPVGNGAACGVTETAVPCDLTPCAPVCTVTTNGASVSSSMCDAGGLTTAAQELMCGQVMEYTIALSALTLLNSSCNGTTPSGFACVTRWGRLQFPVVECVPNQAMIAAVVVSRGSGRCAAGANRGAAEVIPRLSPLERRQPSIFRH
jgi:hypothetical protein